MTDLLPPNATPQERAASLATARVGSVPVPNRNLWSPEDCPLEILPWLAWALSLDDWSPDWSERQKRDAIAASVEIHRRKGTVGAVRRALQAVGYEVLIREGASGAYTFSIYLDALGGMPTDAAFAEAERLALSNKNVRSHLSTVGIFLRTNGSAEAISATVDGESTDIFPFAQTLLSSGGLAAVLSACQDVCTTSVLPMLIADVDLSGNIYVPTPVTASITVQLN